MAVSIGHSSEGSAAPKPAAGRPEVPRACPASYRRSLSIGHRASRARRCGPGARGRASLVL